MSGSHRKTNVKGSSNKTVGSKSHKSLKGALSHIDAQGKVQMVDVSNKNITNRIAVARGHISISSLALQTIRKGAIEKGAPLQAARLAGIMAAKSTAKLIPLCHSIQLTSVDIDIKPRLGGYDIEACVQATAKTGVEMEALTAVSVAALTIYDMVKGVDKTMIIGKIRLVKKTGGRSGTYRSK